MHTLTTKHRKSLIALSLVSGLAVSGYSAAEQSTGSVIKSEVQAKYQDVKVSAYDAWLDGKVEMALLVNEHLNSFNITTLVNGGAVQLLGAVESDIDRDLAGEVAQAVEGVRSVDNKLTVDKALAGKADNAEQESKRTFKQTVKDITLRAQINTELLVNGNTTGTTLSTITCLI